MDTTGRHLLAEYIDCDRELLNDVERIEALMCDAVQAAGATIVSRCFHRFAPQGVTGVVVVEESHLSLHTWPEHGYAAVDFFTCGDCQPLKAHPLLREGLGATDSEVMLLDRGQPGRRSVRIRHHFREEESAQATLDLLAPGSA